MNGIVIARRPLELASSWNSLFPARFWLRAAVAQQLTAMSNLASPLADQGELGPGVEGVQRGLAEQAIRLLLGDDQDDGHGLTFLLGTGEGEAARLEDLRLGLQA